VKVTYNMLQIDKTFFTQGVELSEFSKVEGDQRLLREVKGKRTRGFVGSGGHKFYGPDLGFLFGGFFFMIGFLGALVNGTGINGGYDDISMLVLFDEYDTISGEQFMFGLTRFFQARDTGDSYYLDYDYRVWDYNECSVLTDDGNFMNNPTSPADHNTYTDDHVAAPDMCSICSDSGHQAAILFSLALGIILTRPLWGATSHPSYIYSVHTPSYKIGKIFRQVLPVVVFIFVLAGLIAWLPCEAAVRDEYVRDTWSVRMGPGQALMVTGILLISLSALWGIAKNEMAHTFYGDAQYELYMRLVEGPPTAHKPNAPVAPVMCNVDPPPVPVVIPRPVVDARPPAGCRKPAGFI
jgi:hypothetical protein